MLNPVAVRSWLIAGMAGSNPAKDDIYRSLLFVVRCVGSGLCEEPITHSKESFRVCMSSLCDVRTSITRRLRPVLCCWAA
jgi:hypothetical protein